MNIIVTSPNIAELSGWTCNQYIRRLLTQEATAMLFHSLVTSRLDYCNILYHGIPDEQLNKLQRVQNVAARILTCTKKFDHITPVLKSLHWLPVKARVEYKLLLTTYKAVNGLYLLSIFTLCCKNMFRYHH